MRMRTRDGIENARRSDERAGVELEVEVEVKLGKEKYNERSEECEERGRYSDDETGTGTSASRRVKDETSDFRASKAKARHANCQCAVEKVRNQPTVSQPAGCTTYSGGDQALEYSLEDDCR